MISGKVSVSILQLNHLNLEDNSIYLWLRVWTNKDSANCIRTCRDNNALLEDAGNEFLMRFLRIYYLMGCAQDVRIYQLLTLCCVIIPMSHPVNRTPNSISSFSQGYAKAAFDNGTDKNHSTPKESLLATLQGGHPVVTLCLKGGQGEPDCRPRLNIIDPCIKIPEGLRANEHQDYFHDHLILMLL